MHQNLKGGMIRRKPSNKKVYHVQKLFKNEKELMRK
jgi:hypothetical protein